MSGNKDLVKDGTASRAIGGQSSSKTGKHSSMVKPAATGPDSHSEHKTGPIPGARGRTSDPAKKVPGSALGSQAHGDKAHRF
ncbi:MAG: hypothetical protein HYZ57_18070 [Acidobacteria bacterium]|nr:hypothetical protein [Acidobacteriota bacterium]